MAVWHGIAVVVLALLAAKSDAAKFPDAVVHSAAFSQVPDFKRRARPGADDSPSAFRSSTVIGFRST